MTSSPKDTPQSTPHPRRWWGLAVLCLVLSVLAIDATVLNFAIPAMTADIQPSAPQMLWIVDIYTFALASMLVVMGSVGDRFGRRNVLLWGTAFFAASSAMAGMSHTPELLIAARLIQGVAAACLMPSTLSLIGVMFTNPLERAKAVSMWVATYSVAAACGPLLGGLLLNHFHWGSIFFINVPICIALIIGGVALLPRSKVPAPAPIDVRGAVLAVIALFSLVYVIKVLPHEPVTLTLGIVAAVCLAASILLIRHLTRTTNPLIDITLLRNPTFSTVVTVNGLSMFLYLGVLFYLSQYLQVVAGYSVSQSALLMFPGLVIVVVSTLITGRIMKNHSTKKLLLVALAGAFSGCALLGWGAHLEHGIILAFGFALLNFSLGIIDPISNDYILASAPRDRAGAAASLSETGYELGAAFGTAILGSILMAVYGMSLNRMGLDSLPQAARESISVAHELGLSPPILERVDVAFSHGVIASSAAAALAAAVMAGFVSRYVREDS